jgi:hypothetical protein
LWDRTEGITNYGIPADVLRHSISTVVTTVEEIGFSSGIPQGKENCVHPIVKVTTTFKDVDIN